MTRPKIPDHVVVLSALFLTAYGTNVSTPFLVKYRDRLDLGPSQTQLIFVIYVAGIVTTVLVAGPLSDRFGRKAVCAPFVLLNALGSAIIILGRNSYPLLLTGRLLLGLSVGAVLAVGTAWIQELMGPGTEVKAAILSTVATYGGFGVGPAVSALLDALAPAPLVLPFLLHAGLAIAIVPILLRVAETAQSLSRHQPFRLDLGIPANNRQLFFLAVVPAAIWVFAFPSTSFALFPVLLSDAMSGNEVQVAGSAAALTAWSGLLARPLLPRLGANLSLIAGMAMGLAGYVAGTLAFWTDAWPLVLPGAVLLGAASGMISAGCLALLGAMASDDRRGALTSTFYLLAYPSMSMPVIVTSLASVSSLRAALVTITVAALAGLILVAASSRILARPAVSAAR